eukprot:1059003-Pelagomonas_calceolata.AAC.3
MQAPGYVPLSSHQPLAVACLKSWGHPTLDLLKQQDVQQQHLRLCCWASNLPVLAVSRLWTATYSVKAMLGITPKLARHWLAEKEGKHRLEGALASGAAGGMSKTRGIVTSPSMRLRFVPPYIFMHSID